MNKLILIISLTLLLTSCEALQASVNNPTTVNSSVQNEVNATLINTTNETMQEREPVVVIEPREGSLNLYFLDIEGRATIVQKGQNSILIDGGKETDSSNVLKAIRDLGISELSYIILSHPAPETVGSLPYIILKAKPLKFYESGLGSSEEYGMVEYMFVNSTILAHNTVLDFEPYTKIYVPYSDGNGFADKVEDNSLVTRIIYGKTKIMIMGACGFECEERLLDKDLDADIIEISGSCDSNSLVFLNKVNPSVAIGKNVCPEVERKFKNLNVPLYKIEDGTLSVAVTLDGYEIIR